MFTSHCGANVWCGRDTQLRALMIQTGALEPDAPNLETVPADDLAGKVIGGSPAWWALPRAGWAVEPVYRSAAQRRARRSSGNKLRRRVGGFALYRIQVLGEEEAAEARRQIVGIASRHDGAAALCLEAFQLDRNVLKWDKAGEQDVRGQHIALAGLPLRLACLARSCSLVPTRLPTDIHQRDDLTLTQVANFIFDLPTTVVVRQVEVVNLP